MELKLHFASHPSEDVLEAYALQRLDGEQFDAVDEHIFACGVCQDAVAKIDLIKTTMADVRDYQAQEHSQVAASTTTVRPPAPAEPSAGSLWEKLTVGLRWPKFAMAGVLAAAAAMILVVNTRTDLPTTAVTLSSLRGSDDAALAHAPARSPLELGVDGTRLNIRSGFKMEMVDSGGKPVWHGELAERATGRFSAKLTDKLAPGMYWVRLYDPSAKLVQEFGLRLD